MRTENDPLQHAEPEKATLKCPQGQGHWIQAERLAAINQMATGLAHETRNALQRARGCLDLLELDMPVETEQAILVDRIRAALDDLQRTYEDVTQYAAPIVLSFKRVDLFELCETAFRAVSSEDVERTHRLSLLGDRAIAVAKADPCRIHQLLLNVFENSLAAAVRDVHICVSASSTQVQQLPGIRLEISDDAGGLDEESSRRLFEPFYTTKQRGTGLGLAICSRIIQAHGGWIAAENNSRGGMTLQFALPLQLASPWGEENQDRFSVPA